MRIVVVGATGNLGTALIDELAASRPEDELVGVARRLPDPGQASYGHASWHGLDVSSPSAEDALVRVFRGADAVVALAWALQPNHREDVMRRTNVIGTARIARSAARAGVPHLLYASSVGAYSPGPKDSRSDESWPTDGIPSSHYAKHKAENERMLDRFELENPGVVVTRLRPGLVFQSRAATEILGLFAGRHIPAPLVGRLRLPFLPLPVQIVGQAVHARDVALAFRLAIESGAGGAFNIAAEPPLTPPRVAAAFGARWLPIRFAVMRAIVWASWMARVQASDPGWLDLAKAIPVMSTRRAREVLGWAPTVSATAALRELLDGAAQGDRQKGSAPLD